MILIQNVFDYCIKGNNSQKCIEISFQDEEYNQNRHFREQCSHTLKQQPFFSQY